MWTHRDTITYRNVYCRDYFANSETFGWKSSHVFSGTAWLDMDSWNLLQLLIICHAYWGLYIHLNYTMLITEWIWAKHVHSFYMKSLLVQWLCRFLFALSGLDTKQITNRVFTVSRWGGGGTINHVHMLTFVLCLQLAQQTLFLSLYKYMIEEKDNYHVKI